MSGPVRRGNGRFPFGHAPTPVAQPPDMKLDLGQSEVNLIAKLSQTSGLPPSFILNSMVDAVFFRSKAQALEGLFAALIAQMDAPQQATTADPPPESAAPEETVEGTAEDRLKALREQALEAFPQRAGRANLEESRPHGEISLDSESPQGSASVDEPQ